MDVLEEPDGVEERRLGVFWVDACFFRNLVK